MKNVSTSERNGIEPTKLIGTKWIGWSDFIRDRIMVEFVDKTNCIYTSEKKKYNVTYTITGDKLFISYIESPFELRGHVLFNNNMPAFEKVA